MKREVMVVLGTIWLLVSLGTTGAATLHPSYLPTDQYSPLPPRHRQLYRAGSSELHWNDRDDRTFDLTIGTRTSLPLDEAPGDLLQVVYPEKDAAHQPEDPSNNFPPLKVEQTKATENLLASRFAAKGIGNGGTKEENQGLFSSEASPPAAEDPFVADDTFQDQGPGSVEIYKLDLVKEKALLSPTTTTKSPVKNKSKVPKKTSHVNWKAKTVEFKTTSPKVLHRQSNFFDDLQTDVPPSESFGVGGVPELQVGCEGLEASSHKVKRSIDPKAQGNPYADVTPIALDLDYEFPTEEHYEEMDELLKLKKYELTTKKPKQNRGDMDATLHDNDFFGNKRPDKLPVRGDLGKYSGSPESSLKPPALIASNRTFEKDVGQQGNRGRRLLSVEEPSLNESREDRERNKRSVWGYGEEEGVVSSDELQTENQRRRQYYERMRLEELRRREQAQNQTQTQIHDIRQEYESMLEQRNREEEQRRRRIEQNSSQHTQPHRWREEENQRRRDDEERRRTQHKQTERNYYPSERTWTTERPEHQSHHNNYQPRQRLHEEQERKREEQRLESERRRQEYEEGRRRYEEEQRRRTGEQERRTEETGHQKEVQRRPHEHVDRHSTERDLSPEERRRLEERRRQEEAQRRTHEHDDRERNLSTEERRRLDERRREWLLKKQQHEEEERRRQEMMKNQAPSNLVNPHRSTTNETRRYNPESDRRAREQEERERERKLREYIQRNQPINVSGATTNRREENFPTRSPQPERRQDPYRNVSRNEHEEHRRRAEEHRRRAEEHRRRQEEERRSEEHARRNQSLGSGAIDSQARSYDYFRHPGTELERRAHGPSAPAYGGARSYVDDTKRRQDARRVEDERRRFEDERRGRQEEELKKEMLRREETIRRMQSRRYEEERARQEAVRQEAERRRKELVQEQARRSQAGRTRAVESKRTEYEDHRFQEQRRRPESLVPGNLVLDEARRAAERERQRQEQERRRVEAERRRQEEDRTKEERRKEEHDRAMREQQRRQEEARLNALPVSARIILRPKVSSGTPRPTVTLRTGFGNDIDFPGINPNRQGVKVSRFPAAPTAHPPVQSPGPCVWAVVQCCPTNRNRLVTCFESMGCPGINWDPNPCRGSIAKAARQEIANFYAAAEKNEYSYT